MARPVASTPWITCAWSRPNCRWPPRAQVSLSLITDFENYSVFKPGPQHEQSVVALLDQLISWSRALNRSAQRSTRHQFWDTR